MLIWPTDQSPAVDTRRWTIKNPDGRMKGFSYDLLQASANEEEPRAQSYVRSKLRFWNGRMAWAGCQHDVVANQLILPVDAPDLLANPDRLWAEVDRDVWKAEQSLLAMPTIWIADPPREHVAVRQVAAFAQVMLADRYGVAVHLIAHSPARIGHSADLHVHLLCTARTVGPLGLGRFVQPLSRKGCQVALKDDWDNWQPRLF